MLQSAWNSNMAIRDVNEVITALKGKLMERHLMSKKIRELNEVLEQMNDSTNRIIVEMDNKVNDLNHDWEDILQSQHIKINNKIKGLCDCSNYKKNYGKWATAANVNDPLWRIERRLIQLADKLECTQKIEQTLQKGIDILSWNCCCQSHSSPTSSNADSTEKYGSAERTKLILGSQQTNFPTISELNGVTEMVGTYLLCLKNLERAMKSLQVIEHMPVLFGGCAEGISSIRDVTCTAEVLERVNPWVNHGASRTLQWK
ncbi:unnamed protein product [Thelazia callipaeda]|uniref:Tektin n=1 Tax=Thelazia callipaeda TaxID=103827 RepID=A0A0N5D7S3_THECL|nr:unnamed protein product [Thelazia callipaeda]